MRDEEHGETPVGTSGQKSRVCKPRRQTQEESEQLEVGLGLPEL